MWRFTKHHAVQTYWGNEVAYNYEFLISTPEACERLPLFSVRFIPEDSPPPPQYPPDWWVGTRGRRENNPLPLGIKPRSSRP
jgi:hypothetical protein